MTDWDEVDFSQYMLAAGMLHPLHWPKPWEYEVLDIWHLLTPGCQWLLVEYAKRLPIELHVLGPGLAIVYNPKEPTWFQLFKRFLHDTFGSSNR